MCHVKFIHPPQTYTEKITKDFVSIAISTANHFDLPDLHIEKVFSVFYLAILLAVCQHKRVKNEMPSAYSQ